MKCCDTMDSETKRAIISNSETCIDNLDIYVLFNNNKIEDIHFNGEACAISTSAASIMTRLLKDKTIEEVKELIKEYKDMVETGKEYDRLEEALVYSDIYKQQNRKGCAIIPWLGIEKAIAEYEKAK